MELMECEKKRRMKLIELKITVEKKKFYSNEEQQDKKGK